MTNLVGNEVLQVTPIRFDGALSPITETVTTQDIANLAASAVVSVVGATGVVTLGDLVEGGVATSTSVTAEATRAEAAEAALQTNITAEATTRATADATLQANITAETNARIAADALKAPLASPAFTGAPTAPTPATTDNDTSIATTAYVTEKIASTTAGVSSVVGFSGAVTLAQLVAAGVALASNAGVSSVAGQTGAVSLATLVAAGLAPLHAPSFTDNVNVANVLTALGLTTTSLTTPTNTNLNLQPGGTGLVNFNVAHVDTATAAGGQAVPATVAGYIPVMVQGTVYRIPYFTP